MKLESSGISFRSTFWGNIEMSVNEYIFLNMWSRCTVPSFTLKEAMWDLGAISFSSSFTAAFFLGWITYTVWTVRLCSYNERGSTHFPQIETSSSSDRPLYFALPHRSSFQLQNEMYKRAGMLVDIGQQTCHKTYKSSLWEEGVWMTKSSIPQRILLILCHFKEVFQLNNSQACDQQCMWPLTDNCGDSHQKRNSGMTTTLQWCSWDFETHSDFLLQLLPCKIMSKIAVLSDLLQCAAAYREVPLN